MKKSVRGPVRKVLLFLALLMPVTGLLAAPASAATEATFSEGDITFEGTATLNKFPCPQAEFSTCRGLFKGLWAGSLSGVHENDTYTVEWRTPPGIDRVHALFNYNESLCHPTAPHVGAAAGYARGSGTATASGAEIIGEVWDDLTLMPSIIDNLALTFGFEWNRVGNGAAIIFTSFTIKAWADGRELILVNQGQTGAADFVPTGPGVAPTVPACNQQWTGIEGQIVGHVGVFHEGV
jgi:hypothetical protein